MRKAMYRQVVAGCYLQLRGGIVPAGSGDMEEHFHLFFSFFSGNSSARKATPLEAVGS